VQRPQAAIREAASLRGEAEDAADSLRHHWQTQINQHVAELPAPRGAALPETNKDKEHTEKSAHHEHSPALEKASADLKVRQDADPANSVRNSAENAAAPQVKAPSAPYNPARVQGEQAFRPEERVDRDMRLLQETPDARPVRHLGSIQDFPDIELSAPDGPPSFLYTEDAAQPGANPYPGMRENAVPWENPAAHGWIKAFMSTLHGVLFRSPSFFADLSSGGSLGMSYLFFLIMGYVAILSSLLWSQALAALLPGTVQALTSRLALPVLLLLAPVALGLMLLFVSGCIRLLLLLLAPEKSEFSLVYKLVSYSTAPFVLSIVPFVGPAVGALWFTVVLSLACRHALGLSWKLAVFIPLLPAAMLLGGLIRYFL
jgi:hypothetical protein